MPGFFAWPDVMTAGPEAIGTFVATGIWATSWNYTKPLSRAVAGRYGSGPEAVQALVSARLWREVKSGYKPVTLADIQMRRGCRGTVMLVSRLLPDCSEAIKAGPGALGAWSLAASWSLTSPDGPGFIPRSAVRLLGIGPYVSRLISPALPHRTRLWEQVPGGYLMSDGDHPHEARWQVIRDDERAPILDEIRQMVYARDGYKCVRCGSREDLALDHVYPWSKGGPDTPDNLQTLCRSCNSSKGDRVEGRPRARSGMRSAA